MRNEHQCKTSANLHLQHWCRSTWSELIHEPEWGELTTAARTTETWTLQTPRRSKNWTNKISQTAHINALLKHKEKWIWQTEVIRTMTEHKCTWGNWSNQRIQTQQYEQHMKCSNTSKIEEPNRQDEADSTTKCYAQTQRRVKHTSIQSTATKMLNDCWATTQLVRHALHVETASNFVPCMHLCSAVSFVQRSALQTLRAKKQSLTPESSYPGRSNPWNNSLLTTGNDCRSKNGGSSFNAWPHHGPSSCPSSLSRTTSNRFPDVLRVIFVLGDNSRLVQDQVLKQTDHPQTDVASMKSLNASPRVPTLLMHSVLARILNRQCSVWIWCCLSWSWWRRAAARKSTHTQIQKAASGGHQWPCRRRSLHAAEADDKLPWILGLRTQIQNITKKRFAQTVHVKLNANKNKQYVPADSRN